MAWRHVATSPARLVRQRPQLIVSLAVVLVAASTGAVLLLRDTAPGPGRADSPSAASWNNADRAYVLAMLWHQQQTQELASLVRGRTTRPELERLALSVRTAHTSEVAQMTAWLGALDPAPGDYLIRSDTQAADRWFAGMMARSQLRTLAATSGQRFDFLFVDMLVEHHKGAIVMSHEVLAAGRDEEIALVAGRTVTYSRRAIARLTSWRRRWAEPFLRELTSPAAQSVPASS